MKYKLSASLTLSEKEFIKAFSGQYNYSAYLGDDCDDDLFCLCYQDDILTGYAYLCLFDDAEISGFVLPRYRRRGIFTHMVKLLTKGITCPIVFSGKDYYDGFRQCALSFNAVHCHIQYLMKYDSSLYVPKVFLSDYEVEKNRQEETWFFYMDDEEIGQISLYIEENIINIFNVYMEPDKRGLGYSRLLLSTLLSLIPSDKDIFLQVSNENIPACRLYKTCGFRAVDSVTYYKC